MTGGSGIDVAVLPGPGRLLDRDQRREIQIVDNEASIDGNDGTDTLLGVEKAEFKGGVEVSLAAPIVLDLDGNGIGLREKDTSRASFDWNGDGVRDRTGWVAPATGYLTLDRDGNGTVSGAAELSFIDDKPGAKSDLDGLSAYDSDGDGKLSATNSRWDDFHVWRDANGDGVVGAGEYLGMAEAGISSIALSGSATSRSWGWGSNIVVNNGSFERTDGTSSQLADVALSTSASPEQGLGRPDWAAHARTTLELLRELWADAPTWDHDLSDRGTMFFRSLGEAARRTSRGMAAPSRTCRGICTFRKS